MSTIPPKQPDLNLEIVGRLIPISSELPSLLRFSVFPNVGLEWAEIEIEALAREWPVDQLPTDIMTPIIQDTTIYLHVESVEVKFPFFHKYYVGIKTEGGSIQIRGSLLKDRPENAILLADFIAKYPKAPIVVDHRWAAVDE